MKKVIISMFLSLSLLACNTPKTATPDATVNVPAPAPTEQPLSEKKMTIHALDLTNANVVYLTNEVNAETVNSAISDLNKFNDLNNLPIYLILDTPGGSVIDGGNLISAMQASKNPVYAVDVGIAASMGFMILEHAHKRFATPRAILMAHPASIGMTLQGDLDKSVSRLSFLKRFVDKMDYFIAQRAGVSYESFKLKSDREFWIDAADALDQHYLDAIVSVRLPTQSIFKFGQNRLKEEIRME